MDYQVGQAVIIYIDSADNGLFRLFMQHGNCNLIVFITGIESSGMLISDFNGITGYIGNVTQIKHTATEAEILAEAVKHGWERQDLGYLVGKHINIFKSERKGWRYFGGSAISTENLKELSDEGLIAHRLIEALNLTKQ